MADQKEKKWVHVTCPVCGKTAEFHAWQILRTRLHADAKREVLSGDAFRFRCPDCGCVRIVHHPMFYIDEASLTMIALADEAHHLDLNDLLAGYKRPGVPNPFFPGVPGRMIRMRTVTSVRALQEKIRLFDAGLDDRQVELLKDWYLVEKRNPLPADELRYYKKEETGEEFLVLYVDGSPDSSVRFDRALYGSFAPYLDGLGSEREETESLIDSVYAHALYLGDPIEGAV